MNQKAIEQLAGELFKSLLGSGLDEAETVAALAIAVTMRLAYNAQTMDEVIAKLEALNPIFLKYARQNYAAFAAAQAAKEVQDHA